MEKNRQNGAQPVLPPEYGTDVRAEYGLPAPEFAPLPPEFDPRGRSGEAEPGKKRNLRWLMALPILVLLAVLCWSAGPKEPDEPDLPQGSVVIDLVRAGVTGNTVVYTYTVYTPIPSLDATEEQREAYKNGTPWPVSVYAKVTDEAGNTAVPETDPDLWEGTRELDEDRIDVTGLKGKLTLTLLALYIEQDQPRQSVVTRELEPFSDEPAVSAQLEVFPGGEVDFTAVFLPPPGSGEYDLEVCGSGQYVYYEGEKTGLSLLDNPRGLPITGDRESGYTVHYSGGSGAIWLPEEAELSLYVIFEDRSTGQQYLAESNRVSLYGVIEKTDPEYPLGDGTIVISVFNDTTTFEFPDLPTAEDGYRTLLDTVTIPEAEFEGYSLPSAWTPEGYDFAGWVVHVGNPLDPGGEEDLFSQYNGDPPVEAMLPEGSYAFRIYGELTPEDVEKVPPNEDGMRYVNLHAVWIKQEPRDERLLLSNGEGGFTSYDMMVPLASEGFLYLCNYPVPTREGMEFDGWYDEDGNRVELLVCFFSFTPVQHDEAGNFAGYDWNAEKTVVLTARWTNP